MNQKLKKSQRIALLSKQLVAHPWQLFTLHYLGEWLNAAKSTLSEDIQLIEESFLIKEEGRIVSVSGAAGGIYYAPYYNQEQIQEVRQVIVDKIKDPSRIIPGGYIYMTDIFYSPGLLEKMAISIISQYDVAALDYIVTIETKGIPLAMTIARLVNKPIAVVRKSARMTEGTTIQMNYVTGSSKTIKTMALPLRSVKRGSQVLFVDDFMKAGGTAKGIIDLMKEFDCQVLGVAVVLSKKSMVDKLIDDYFSLVEYEGIDPLSGEIKIHEAESMN